MHLSAQLTWLGATAGLQGRLPLLSGTASPQRIRHAHLASNAVDRASNAGARLITDCVARPKTGFERPRVLPTGAEDSQFPEAPFGKQKMGLRCRENGGACPKGRSFYRTISGVRLPVWWELEEPKGPKGSAKIGVLHLDTCWGREMIFLVCRGLQLCPETRKVSGRSVGAQRNLFLSKSPASAPSP